MPSLQEAQNRFDCRAMIVALERDLLAGGYITLAEWLDDVEAMCDASLDYIHAMIKEANDPRH